MDIDMVQYKLNTEEINYNKIFLLSDLHFGVRANSLEWVENQRGFFTDFYIPFLKENVKKGDILFILGDVFDNRQMIDIFVMNIVIDLFIELSNILPVHIMAGNHDIYKKYDTNINSLKVFKSIPNIKIYENPIVISNKKSSILILTWFGNKEKEENFIKYNPTDYIFAHGDFSGFKRDNGTEINKGIDLNTFSFKRIISGHIHKRQESENFIYLGSPYHTKRSDIGNTKGVYVFAPNNNKIFFKENDFSPKFQRVYLESILELTKNDVSKILNNNYTDIIVPNKWIHLFNLTKFIDILDDCKFKKIETVGEKRKYEENISEVVEDIDIRDIPTLLDNVIIEFKFNPDTIAKLRTLNKQYYEKSTKEETQIPN
jgi:DNA repair exonuclease SbcCD nuclease subunit